MRSKRKTCRNTLHWKLFILCNQEMETPIPWHLKLETRKSKSSGSAFVTNYSVKHKIMEEVDHVGLLSSSSSSRVATKSESSHMTSELSAFPSYTQVLCQTVQMGARATAPVAGKGDVIMNMMTNGSPSTLKLTNVLHVPSFKFQLLSSLRWTVAVSLLKSKKGNAR